MGNCELDQSDSREVLVLGPCEQGNESLVPQRRGIS